MKLFIFCLQLLVSSLGFAQNETYNPLPVNTTESELMQWQADVEFRQYELEQRVKVLEAALIKQRQSLEKSSITQNALHRMRPKHIELLKQASPVSPSLPSPQAVVPYPIYITPKP